MATPEGFVAFWIFRPVSMTASICSGVSVPSRSTTPSARSLTFTNICTRCSTGATCLMRLTITPLGFRARSRFVWGLITAAHCGVESISRASPTQDSRPWVSTNSVGVMLGSSSCSSSSVSLRLPSPPPGRPPPPTGGPRPAVGPAPAALPCPSFSAAAACASAEAALASCAPASPDGAWLCWLLSMWGKRPRGSTGGALAKAPPLPEPPAPAPGPPRRASAAEASQRTFATPDSSSFPAPPGAAAPSEAACPASSPTKASAMTSGNAPGAGVD
mmetsp:Transcript_44447/g.128656  ORF Transcript_44447/g.128656 Transcript_44447/m.128656 type:complete len:274 (+) Transcript_44447:741-1562(+)